MPKQFYLSNSAVPTAKGSFGKWRYIAAGLLLLGLPFLAIFYQSYRIGNGIIMRLPVQVSHTQHVGLLDIFPKVKLSTPLNFIQTRTVAGQNNFLPHDSVFVFLSPGPNDIWYPYAISKRPPEQGCQVDECLVLSGKIKSVSQDTIGIRYQYEDFVPSRDVLNTLNYAKTKGSEITLVVGKDGRTAVRALYIDGKTLNQRSMEISTLWAFTKNTAKKAPVK